MAVASVTKAAVAVTKADAKAVACYGVRYMYRVARLRSIGVTCIRILSVPVVLKQ